MGIMWPWAGYGITRIWVVVVVVMVMFGGGVRIEMGRF